MNNRIFSLSLSIAMMISCGRGSEKKEGTEPVKTADAPNIEMTTTLTPEQIRNGNIRLGITEKRDMHRVLHVNGYIDVPPDRLVTVSFPLGGTIEKIELLPGMPVSKGAKLITLQDPQYIELQQQYLAGSSRLQYLETDYKRQKELHETQAASEKTFQQAETEYRTQQVNVKALEEKLKLIGIDPQKLTVSNMSSKVTLIAPVTGFISKVNVNRGQYINPNDVLFEIIDPGDNHLNLSVLENDLGALSVGQEVTCHPNNKPDRSYHARILLINRSVGDDRSSEVHCHFEGSHPELAPGMFMNAEIAVIKKQVTAVPNDAIVRWQNKQYIFSAKSDQEFELIPVETGIMDNDYTEIILSNLPEKIVVGNAYNILMKMKNSGE